MPKFNLDEIQALYAEISNQPYGFGPTCGAQKGGLLLCPWANPRL